MRQWEGVSPSVNLGRRHGLRVRQHRGGHYFFGKGRPNGSFAGGDGYVVFRLTKNTIVKNMSVAMVITLPTTTTATDLKVGLIMVALMMT